MARENTEYHTLDASVRDLLETTNTRIWNRIHAEPDTYVLSLDEFAVFNFYRNTWTGNQAIVGQAAVARYWSQPNVNGA